MVPNPLRYEPKAAAALKVIQYAGYEQITSLAYTSEEHATRFPVSIWDAIELPAGGQIVIPTVRDVQPRDFFEATALIISRRPGQVYNSGSTLKSATKLRFAPRTSSVVEQLIFAVSLKNAR